MSENMSSEDMSGNPNHFSTNVLTTFLFTKMDEIGDAYNRVATDIHIIMRMNLIPDPVEGIEEVQDRVRAFLKMLPDSQAALDNFEELCRQKKVRKDNQTMD